MTYAVVARPPASHPKTTSEFYQRIRSAHTPIVEFALPAFIHRYPSIPSPGMTESYGRRGRLNSDDADFSDLNGIDGGEYPLAVRPEPEQGSEAQADHVGAEVVGKR